MFTFISRFENKRRNKVRVFLRRQQTSFVCYKRHVCQKNRNNVLNINKTKKKTQLELYYFKPWQCANSSSQESSLIVTENKGNLAYAVLETSNVKIKPKTMTGDFLVFKFRKCLIDILKILTGSEFVTVMAAVKHLTIISVEVIIALLKWLTKFECIESK